MSRGDLPPEENEGEPTWWKSYGETLLQTSVDTGKILDLLADFERADAGRRRRRKMMEQIEQETGTRIHWEPNYTKLRTTLASIHADFIKAGTPQTTLGPFLRQVWLEVKDDKDRDEVIEFVLREIFLHAYHKNQSIRALFRTIADAMPGQEKPMLAMVDPNDAEDMEASLYADVSGSMDRTILAKLEMGTL